MKTTLSILISTFSVFTACHNQAKKENPSLTENKTVADTLYTQQKRKPGETIKVNKQYDKKGNLISFDSTYTCFFGSKKPDRPQMDSLLKEFERSSFNRQFPLMNDNYFKDLFLNDSLIRDDFFHEDFFRKRFELNEQYMRKVMKEMDSVKNEFFRGNAAGK